MQPTSSLAVSTERVGELFIIAETFFWSLFPVMTILTFGTLTPLYTAAISTVIAALFFAVGLTAKRQWHHLLRRKAWRSMFLTSLFIGVLFYACMFMGLRHTTAGNASILSLMEVFFSFVILGVLLRHEPVLPLHLLGGVLMVIGAGLILLPGMTGWQQGNLLVVSATFFAPWGNKYAQQARKIVSAEAIMFCRSVIGSLFLFLLAALFETPPSWEALHASAGFLLVNGMLLLGLSKIFWLEGIARLPITKAISLGSLAPAFTLIVAYVVLHEQVTAMQVLGFLPIAFGVYLLTKKRAALSSVVP
ncbi:MAG: DMT family transporter [Candidatus Peribacteraceae bacterium]|nr:DMT family transporter [Candidatus Peribacteraceae bacterium]